MQPTLLGDAKSSTAQKKKTFVDEEDDLTKVNTDMSCYESTLNCCGVFWGSLRAWCPCVFFCCPYPYFQVNQGQKGLLQKFGKFQRQLEPGLHEINPCTDRILTVYTKTFVISPPRQVVLTKDNITVEVDAIVYYRVINPIKSTYRVKDITQAVQDITIATLRTVGGEHTLQDMLEHRQKIADEIEKFVIEVVQDWGIYVEKIFIKDMLMSETLQSSLSMAPKTRRIGESKIISAKADVEAAKLLREASDMLSSKAAMQIRYFETIQNVAKGDNQKILFLPLSNSDKK